VGTAAGKETDDCNIRKPFPPGFSKGLPSVALILSFRTKSLKASMSKGAMVFFYSNYQSSLFFVLLMNEKIIVAS